MDHRTFKSVPFAHLGAAAFALAVAVMMTWPLAATASNHILRAAFHWDAYTNAMIMGARLDAALGRGPLALYDNYFFAPLPNTIVFNENHFGLSLIFAPFALVSNNPLWAYNMTLLVSMALSVFFTYLFVHRLTRSGEAGLLAGVAFAFCPYALFEIGRIQLVATQWIPACFYFLHRAFEQARKRDICWFWLCYLLQIGTCLYYAMFLIPLLTAVGVALVRRQPPSRRFAAAFASVGALAGGIALAMVYPYFATRGSFDLERSLEFASAYDGRLEFFTHVPITNRTLTQMHHTGAFRGAYEEIAFPGFVAISMMLLGVTVAFAKLFRRGLLRVPVVVRVAAWIFGALVLSALMHSMLAGLLALVFGWWREHRRVRTTLLGSNHGVYCAVLLLAVCLFLGLSPFDWQGAPVRGLYYYFHTYFPGFNGIRKVSRQAVMTTFLVCVLASYGSSFLFSKLRSPLLRATAFAALLGLTSFELRSFPHPVTPVWAGSQVPKMLRFVSALPQNDLVAAIPQSHGTRTFRGDSGMALHNYLALYHRHRFVNGQSSWMPPANELARQALRSLPDDSSRRALLTLGTKHVMVFGNDLPRYQAHLKQRLLARPNEYRLEFDDGNNSVWSLLVPPDPTLELMDTPQLPEGLRRIPPSELRAYSPLRPDLAGYAIDQSLESFWSGRRPQAPGQTFEVHLGGPHRLAALEIRNPGRAMDVPAAFELSIADEASPFRPVIKQSKLRLYRDQVYSPKTFVFRLVLPQAQLAQRVRLTLTSAVPGHYFSIHDLRLFEAPP